MKLATAIIPLEFSLTQRYYYNSSMFHATLTACLLYKPRRWNTHILHFIMLSNTDITMSANMWHKQYLNQSTLIVIIWWNNDYSLKVSLLSISKITKVYFYLFDRNKISSCNLRFPKIKYIRSIRFFTRFGKRVDDIINIRISIRYVLSSDKVIIWLQK